MKDSVTIGKGRIIIYRLFDVALGIDLAMIDRFQKEGSKRLKFSKYPYTNAIEFTNPPISFELNPFTKDLFGTDTRINVIAKAYDFGVISIAFDVPIPEGAGFDELEKVARGLDTDSAVEEKARQYVVGLMESLGQAIISPEIKEGFVEDYMIFYLERLGQDMSVHDFLQSYDPSRLLLYESRELSAFTKKETLKHSFSYYPDDLTIIHMDNALIIEPSGNFDLPDILEFANAQIFELRYYDRVIDRELKLIYGELSKRRSSFLGLRQYERLAKKITQTVTDITEVTERVNNSLKVTEDIYYARIYRTFMSVLRSRDWETSIREKLNIIMNTYKMLHDEISVKRDYAVELGIFFLILIDMVLVIFR